MNTVPIITVGLLIYGTLLNIISCHQPSDDSDILGVWKLHRWEAFKNDSLFYPYGPEAEGQLIYYPNGQMSFMLSKKNRVLFGTEDRSKISAEQALKANNSFFAYWGTFKINRDSNMITHQIEQSLLPDWSGQKQQRHFTVSQDTLLLVSDMVAGKTHRLTWIKSR